MNLREVARGSVWCPVMDESRKRVLLIAASILAARKLAQFDSGARVPATVSAIADAIRWAERIPPAIYTRRNISTLASKNLKV
ncbi:MAG: hypothetical protein ABSF66_11190 [Terriglobales bacterium]